MPITRQQKEKHVEEINNLISKSNMIIVWDYLGLSAEEFSNIRAILRNEEGFNKVYKNRVAKVAFKNSGKEEILEYLTGPSSFLFVESEDSKVLTELNKFIKDNEQIAFKAAYIDGEFYDTESLKEMAGLPSKNDLLSMLLSALQGTMRNLAYAISQVASKSPSQESATSEEKEEVKEEIKNIYKGENILWQLK